MTLLITIVLILAAIGLLSPVVGVCWWVWVQISTTLDRIHDMLSTWHDNAAGS